MFTHILKILRNEYKSNILILVELIFVGAFLWYLVDNTYVVLSHYFEPLGFETEHTYIATIGYLNERSPYYQKDLTKEEQTQQLHTLLERVQHHPDIEAAGYSFYSSPHIGSNRMTLLGRDTIVTKYSVVFRTVTPGFFRVFRWKSVDGSTDELEEALRRGEAIIPPSVVRELFPDGQDPVGQEIIVSPNHSGEVMKVGAVSTTIRYDNFRNLDAYFAAAFSEGYYDYFAGPGVDAVELCFRVRPDADHDFISRFRAEMTDRLRIGNYFLSKINYIPDNKKDFQRRDMNDLYTECFIALFLLINILLGVVGVFWFRTQARIREMGVRMSFGDTPRKILRRYYVEGLILLFVALLPVMPLMYYLSTIDVVNTWLMDFTFHRFVLGYLMTYISIGVMIVAGVWFPAHNAVRIPPAQALATE